jgi:hypothetical protein
MHGRNVTERVPDMEITEAAGRAPVKLDSLRLPKATTHHLQHGVSDGTRVNGHVGPSRRQQGHLMVGFRRMDTMIEQDFEGLNNLRRWRSAMAEPRPWFLPGRSAQNCSISDQMI